MEKQNSNFTLTTTTKAKLLCSYGGKIQPRPSDHQLTYIGGDTKILAVDRHVTFSEFSTKLNSLCNNKFDNSEVSIKYQLPGHDLDSLISLIDDDDVEHMMVEYDRMQRISPPAKPAKLRLFIFDVSKKDFKSPNPNPDPNPDYLFGFDKEYQPSIGPPLDLLQILPRDGFQLMKESHVSGGVGVSSGNLVGPPVVYRVPVVAGGGEYFMGYGVATGMGRGYLEQPVYNFVPVMPSVQEQTVRGLKG